MDNPYTAPLPKTTKNKKMNSYVSVLSKGDTSWSIFGAQTDSASTAGYLAGIRYLNNSNFVDDVPSSVLVSPTVSISIKQNSKPDILVKAFQHPVHQWIVNSSENPQSYFAEKELVDKLFVSRDKLLQGN